MNSISYVELWIIKVLPSFFMIFLTLEHILTHISFLVISIVIIIHFLTLLVNEFVEFYDLS
jgi:hypothetical protein